MKYVLDTNILIHKVRKSSIWERVQQEYLNKGLKNHAYISFATTAEALTFAKANAWGKAKMEDLRQTLQQRTIIESNYPKLLKGYVNIDLYSQNRHQSLRLPSSYSARNMGKNDIWIAATAAALRYPLIA